MTTKEKTPTTREEFKARSRPLFYAPHYIFLGKTLADQKPVEEDTVAMNIWRKNVFHHAHDLEGDNDRFNRKKFLTDCGLPPPKRSQYG